VTAAVSGRLRLEAARRGERTVLTGVCRTVPFHPGPLHYRNGRAEVMVQDVSPGIFPGDRLEIDITVNEGAALTVSGQSATKIYPSPRGLSSEVSTVLKVDRGATLWWLPGDLIPFRDAIYATRTNVVLDEGARFALLEIVTPGRMAMGERDAYSRLDVRLRIDVAGKPVFIDRSVLDPRQRPLSSIGNHGDFACSGLLVAVGYSLPPSPERCANEVWIGADGDRELVVARGLAHAAAPLREALRSLLTRLDEG
jgi:urease accessory protein UreH